MPLPGVYIDEASDGLRPIEGVATSIAAFVGEAKLGPADEATEILGFADFERVFGPLDPEFPLTYAVQQFFVNGGRRAYVVRASSGRSGPAEAVRGDPGATSGIYALDDVDLFNLLVLPEVAVADAAVTAAALAYCEARRAFMILDPPPEVSTPELAQAWIKAPGTPKSANGAAYFPRPRFPDPLQGDLPRSMPAAGAIAGLFARVDTAHGVWRAPAGPGASLNGAASLEVSLDDADAATINALGLNTIRLIRNRGVVVWGARTLVGADQTSSEWKYVPVRRTALYIEGSVSRGTQWAVFEPNGEPLWAQIRLSVDAFMRGLFDEGAFQGTSPQQAYFVRCGSDTTTEADIDAGIVNIVVGFAPLRPAEFVVIRIGQRARPGKTAAGGCQRVST